MAKQMKVGVFVMFGLLLLAAGIFLIGENRKFWESKVFFTAAFKDVGGLRGGAVVRSGGIDIGNVASVGHGKDPDDPRIWVKLAIVKDEAERIHQGTVARVINKGLLGEKLVELTVVNSGVPQDPAEPLVTEEPRDFMANADQLAGKVGTVLNNIEPLSKTLGSNDLGENIRASAESMKESAQTIKTLLSGLAENDSIAHRVLLDPDEGKRFHDLLDNVTAISGQLKGISEDTHALTSQVRSGHGAVGALLYNPELESSVAKMAEGGRRTTEALATAAEAINGPDNHGLLHSAVYGDKENHGWISNITQMTSDLRDIVRSLRDGKGTIGALLVDPTVYEDLKSAIGNVERNQVLRAIVRYSIKADEAKR